MSLAWDNGAEDGSGHSLVVSAIQPGDADVITLDMLIDINTDTFLGRVTASSGTVEILTNAQAKTALDLSGTNSGDQTDLTGISDTKANFNAALSDGSFVFVGDAPTTHNHDSDYISIVSTPTIGNFPQLTAGGELINSAYDETSFATVAHNHDSAYISIIGAPTAGNFPEVTAGGELTSSSYAWSSFATAAQGILADSALQPGDLLVNKYDATTIPSANDDSANTSGNGVFGVGSIWIDVTADIAYICVDSTAQNAIWNQIDATGGGAGSVSGLDINATINVEPSATGNDAFAMGDGAVASGANAVALGSLTDATATDTVAIGNGAQADRASEISINSGLTSGRTGHFSYTLTTSGTNIESIDTPIPTNTSMLASAYIIARRIDALTNPTAGYILKCVIDNNNGTMGISTFPRDTIQEDDTGLDCNFSISGTNLRLTLTGGTVGATVRWVIKMDYAEARS